MKNSKTRSGNIFASIKEEEEKEKKTEIKAKNTEVSTNNSRKKQVESSVKKENTVDSATKKPETMAKSTKAIEEPVEAASNGDNSNSFSNNPGINYSNALQNRVDSQVNNGLLYIVPTKKKTRNHRKGFLLSDLALENLQKEAAKYEISENELINQILEKMV